MRSRRIPTSLLLAIEILLVAPGFGPISSNAAEPAKDINVSALLKEASDLTVHYKKVPSFFMSGLPLRIAKAQMSEGDLDGALATLVDAANEYEARPLVIEVAERLARRGRREQADRASQRIDVCSCTEQESLEERLRLDDKIRLAHLEYQITIGDFVGATKTQREITTPTERPIALNKLAVGYAKIGDTATSIRLFRDAIAADVTLPIKKIWGGDAVYFHESSEVHALCETCDAEIDVHDADGAAATSQTLAQMAESFEDGLCRMDAFYEAGLQESKLGHRAAARRLLTWAASSRDAVKPPSPNFAENRARRLATIAKAQAELGYLDDATATLGFITGDRARTFEESADIAAARARAGDIAGATAAALSFDFAVRKKALLAIMMIQIDNFDMQGALATAAKIDDRVEQTVARLTIAAKYAIRGQRVFAVWTAEQIRLAAMKGLIDPQRLVFDYRKPRSWGQIYDASVDAGHRWYLECEKRAGRLAAATMVLSQNLNQRSQESYAALFADFCPEVIVALARAHALAGSPHDALDWARKIGATEPTPDKEDSRRHVGIEQRIAALLGVAEGILERQGKLQASVDD
jgi:hypothetical protein